MKESQLFQSIWKSFKLEFKSLHKKLDPIQIASVNKLSRQFD